uniref:GAF domain-containing protein n=1 Tax=candidate division WOR-3 bacterium TaxID=2052148 RepID=A0A7C4U894_UNCW3
MVYDKIEELLDKEDLVELFKATKIINSIDDVDIILEKILDIAIERTGAERGALVLLKNGNEYEVKVARNMDKESIENPKEISFTIINDCIKEGKPILTADAKKDPRFADSESVILYNIFSIIATPLTVKNRIIGAIYIDRRSSLNLFSEKEKNFIDAFSHIAGIAIENLIKKDFLIKENLRLKKELKDQYNFYGIVGKSRAIKNIIETISKVANNDVPVLIEGESGTGKELVARTIHYSGKRKDYPFVPVYCGGIPETLIESELFGAKKGSYTGAYNDKIGLIEEAHNGTFFLDEISEIPLYIQPKLLRVLEERRFRRIGETKERYANFRLISATNKTLIEEVKKGNFREDLYYRIKVVSIYIPPLRERKEDIPLLIEHFLKKYSNGEKVLSKEVFEFFMEYEWRGNVRELENVISNITIMSKGNIITMEDLPKDMFEKKQKIQEGFLKDIEKETIINVLKLVNGNKKIAAEKLGISLRTLYNKIKEYNITDFRNL